MKSQRLPLVAAVLALAGCMQPAPRYERPPAPVPEVFPGAGAPAASASAPGTPGAGRAAAELPWADFVADPLLRDLIGRALTNNRDLRIALLNAESAAAQWRSRQADQWPTVNAGFSAARQTNSSGQPVGAYAAGLSVAAYELDLFGRVASLSDAAAAQFLAAEQARRAAQISLVAAVAQQYIAWSADEELLELTRRTLATREASLELTQLKVQHGAASALDLRQAQSLVEAARVAAAQFERQRQLDRNALALLVGQALPGNAAVPARVDALALAEVPAGLPSEVLLARPDVRQAEQQLIAANANIGAARAAFWPRITLTASAGTASSELSRLFRNGAWSFAAQLLQPIFDAGRNRANLEVAERQRDIALAQYERAIQASFRDVADALAGRGTLGEQLRATRAQAEAERARYELVELRARNGAANALELLDAERALFAARQAVVQTQLAELQNRVAVYRAVGGGLGG